MYGRVKADASASSVKPVRSPPACKEHKHLHDTETANDSDSDSDSEEL